MTSKEIACEECKTNLVYGQKYCSNCGIEIDWSDYGIACSECNSELVQGQKYCANCGIEIVWSDDTDSSLEANKHLTSGVKPNWLDQDQPISPKWLDRHYQVLGPTGKTFAICWFLLNTLAFILMPFVGSSSNDSSDCNGLYDANILKTYGVFQCPAIYNSTRSSFLSYGLTEVLIINAVFAVFFFPYTTYKIYLLKKKNESD